MQTKPSQAVQRQDHLFQARLDQQLNLRQAHKKYEIGCKVAVATTSKSNWVVAAPARAR
jgi:hypothetical protein